MTEHLEIEQKFDVDTGFERPSFGGLDGVTHHVLIEGLARSVEHPSHHRILRRRHAQAPATTFRLHTRSVRRNDVHAVAGDRAGAGCP